MPPRIDDHRPDRILSGHRSIRSVAPPESPWAGTLTVLPTGETVELVNAEQFGPDWVGWEASASGHLLAPLDLIRRPDGHDVAFPVCTERVDVFVARRDAVGAPLADGEVVTLAVSALRGAAELARLRPAESIAGTWWLADAGRPVLAAGGGVDAASSTAELLQTLAASAQGATADVLADAAAAVDDPRSLVRALDELESRLFEEAEAVSLDTAVYAPLRARAIASVARDEPAVEPGHVRTSRWLELLGTHVDADVADLVSVASTGLWRRFRSRRPGGRRRPWIIATGVAGAVVGIGLLWPAGTSGPATADAASSRVAATAAAASTAGSPEPSPGADDPGAAATEPNVGGAGAVGDTWTRITDELLAARTACGDAPACLRDVVEDPSRAFPDGAIDLPSSERTVTLLDEFGGAAVLRVDPLSGGTAAQLVVLVQVDHRTLVRDVHDVADQSR